MLRNTIAKDESVIAFADETTPVKEMAARLEQAPPAAHGGGARPLPPLDWSQQDTQGDQQERCWLPTAVLTRLGFLVAWLVGCLGQLSRRAPVERNRKGYAPLFGWRELFLRDMHRRARRSFDWPVCSAAGGAEISIKERASDDHNWTLRFTGRTVRCVNLGSYSYLGYSCGGAAAAAAAGHGLALASARAELGHCALHARLEEELAAFLGVEAALVFGMGFASNALALPALLPPGTLALSDELCHASLALALRLSRATVRVFRHNDARHLERLARVARAEGCWTHIVIVMEGVYSMQGSVGALPAAVALKKQLGLHLYLDEAHSMGVLGARGRGVCELLGVDPRDVDVLMGTFSKSFAAAGGYVAGPARLVRWLRWHGHAHTYAHALAPPVAQHVLSALEDLRAPSGLARLDALRRNTHYFRTRLRRLGVVTCGHPSSPLVPMLVFGSTKAAVCAERLQARGVACVCAAFLSVPPFMARIRFCVSAAHSRAQLDHCLAAIEAVADELGLRYSRRPPPSPTRARAISDTKNENVPYELSVARMYDVKKRE